MSGIPPFLRGPYSIKKESPNEGTETVYLFHSLVLSTLIKKESPNEGTETHRTDSRTLRTYRIKKESPNEGTET